jgi:predicted transcriptional regulator
MSKIGDEIEEMLNELANEGLPLLDENDLTRQKIMDKLHVSETTARRKSQKMLDAGKWVAVVKRTKDGNSIITYKKVI